MNNQLDLAVKQALTTWNSNIKNMTDTFNGLSEEQMHAEIAPGKNRPLYLLGHMAAVHDMMMPLLGLGERKMEHLDEAFLKNPDRTVAELPSTDELKGALAEANDTLNTHFAKLTADDWFQKHTKVTDEDFAKEPNRNKFSILTSRTNHIAYHNGQLALAKGK
jgi:uncharacterized damage-inducible protein DinB